MRLHQVLTGAANVIEDGVAVAHGSVSCFPFTVYGSGYEVVILDSHFNRVQIISNHTESTVKCIACSFEDGKIAVSFGTSVTIYQPLPFSLSGDMKLPYQWKESAALKFESEVKKLCWDHEGKRLLVGSNNLHIYRQEIPLGLVDQLAAKWKCVWERNKHLVSVFREAGTSHRCRQSPVAWALMPTRESPASRKIFSGARLAAPPKFLEFSPDGHFFASAGQKDCMVKIWFRAPNVVESSIATPTTSPRPILPASLEKYNFIYILHPAAVQSFSWRKISKHMPLSYTRGVSKDKVTINLTRLASKSSCSVPNILLTSCADNVCRLWAETVKYKPSHHRDHQPEKNQSSPRSTSEHQPVSKQRSDSELKNKTEAQVVHEAKVHIHQRYHLISMFHFHLAAVINPSSDIALLSTIPTSSIFGRSFQLQWLNNKEVQLTTAVEAIYASLRKNTSTNNIGNDTSDTDPFLLVGDVGEGEIGYEGNADVSDKTLDRTLEEDQIEKDIDDNDNADGGDDISDGDDTQLETKLESDSVGHQKISSYRNQLNNLLHNWCSSSDTLYCIHPADGSLLIWVVDYLDDFTSAYYRQVQVSFASRVPATFSKADASSLCWTQAYHYTQPVYKSSPEMESGMASFLSQQTSPRQHTNKYLLSQKNMMTNDRLSVLQVSYLVSAHADGSLNLWLLTFSESGSFTGIASITHVTRSCGPRFETTQLVGHPILPIIIGTSKQTRHPSENVIEYPVNQFELKPQKLSDIKSELILWHNSHVSPLSEFKGVTEMARISSSNLEEFLSISWIPVLYQDSLLSITNDSVELIPHTPCACFVAASNHGLVLYQILLDAKSLLSHLAVQQIAPMQSRNQSLSDFIESEQSGSNSACIMKLCTLEGSATVARNVQFLHIYNKKSLSEVHLSETQEKDECSKLYVVAVCNDILGQMLYVWSLEMAHEEKFDVKSPQSPESLYSDSTGSPTSPQALVISHCVKQKLIYEHCLFEDCNATIFSSAADIHCSINLNTSCPVQYNFLSTLLDGSIKFWDLQINENDELRVLEAGYLEAGHNDDKSVILCVACAGADRFACFYKHVVSGNKVNFDLYIKENESSGELVWNTESKIRVLENVVFDPSVKFELSWLALGNGSHLLAVAVNNTVFVYSLVRSYTASHTVVTNWEILKEIKLTNDEDVLRLTTISWASGFFLIGVENEIQVYSQWEDSKKEVKFKRQTSVSELCSDETSEHGIIITKNSFTEACNAMKSLPQYHPNHLLELLNLGKMRRVRAVLGHLVCCVAGKDAAEAAAEQGDVTEEVIQRPRAKTLTKTLSNLADYPTSPTTNEITISQPESSAPDILVIPPLPLTKLQQADKDESATLANEKGTLTSEAFHQGTGMSSSAVYYGLAQAQLLTDQLSRKQLPGLTSQEQMYLIALSDTIATTNFEFEALTPSEMKYTKQESLDSNILTLSSGGGGYATTGATGVGSFGSDSVDDCGLRFLLSMRQHTALMKSLSNRQQTVLKEKGMSSSDYCWAFHSDCKEELLATIPGMARNEPTWSELKSHGCGWWIRSNDMLRRTIEKVAKAHFQATKDPLDCAIFYLAMKKKTLLCALYRSLRDSKMSAFFSNNFDQERWRKAAMKNAFALLGKQRFEHAAAFFLLGNALWDAVQVCVNRLHDIQLALVIVRLYEGNSENHTRILQKYVLGLEEEALSNDPFHCSMANWILKEYSESLDILLQPLRNEKKTIEANYPGIFNFYHYLRTHPLLRRRHLTQHKTLKSTLSHSLSASHQNNLLQERKMYERKLYFRTTTTHLNAGLPDIALEVLLLLPSASGSDEEVKDVDEKQQQEYHEDMIITGTFAGDLKVESTSQSSIKTTDNVTDGHGWGSTNGTITFQSNRFADLDDEYQIGISLSDSDDDSDVSENEAEKSTEENTSSNKETESTKEENIEEETKEIGKQSVDVFDIVALNLKYTCIIRCLLEVLKVLPLKCTQDHSKLRASLNALLEQELEYLHQICDYGRKDGDSQSTEKLNDAFIQQRVEDLRDARRALSVSSIGSFDEDTMSLGEKVEQVALHSEWLKRNRVILTSLYEHCLLVGSGDAEIPAVCLELLLLLHEIEGHRVLSSPLTSISAGPSAPPLLLASMASYSLVASPNAFLRSMTHDLLQTVINLPAFPTPQNPVTRLADLENLMYSLSSCIYHSLCGGDDDRLLVSIRKGETQLIGKQMKDGKLCRLPYGSIDVELDVTSQPSSWPGVKFFLSILTASNKDGSQSLKLLLCEAAIAVYLSMFVSASSRLSCNSLFRLVLNGLSDKMWSSVFGGGTKIVVPAPEVAAGGSSPRRNSSPRTQKKHDTARMRWNYKLLGKNAPPTQGSQQQQEDSKKLVRHEVFIPPTVCLSDYFMTKNENYSSQFDYNSDDDEDTEEDDMSDLTQHLSQSPVEDDGFIEESKIQEIEEARKKERMKLFEHYDSTSQAWLIMQIALLKNVSLNITSFLTLAGLDMSDLPTQSPLVYNATKILLRWEQVLTARLEHLPAETAEDLIHYEPCLQEDGVLRGGATLQRNKVLLDPKHTPFSNLVNKSKPAKRLWHLLVQQESLRQIFLHYVFKATHYSGEDETDFEIISGHIIHKDPEPVTSFSLNKSNYNYIAVSTMHEIIEYDITGALDGDQDMYSMEKNAEGSDERLKGKSSPKIIQRRPCSGIRRMDSHPSLPYYVAGGSDGSVRMFEFVHPDVIAQFRGAGQNERVNKVQFNPLGNKFAVADDSGFLSMWLVANTNDASPYLTIKCHSKCCLDFAYLGSSSLIATVGGSTSEKRNICIWDTLLPPKKALVHTLTHNTHGASSLVYVPGQQCLITGGRRGDICIFDVRQRRLLYTFTGHNALVKTITVDPSEMFFVTGAADGDIKIWGLTVHELFESFLKEHARGTVSLRHQSPGVQCMYLLQTGHLFSCGGDGTLKWRVLNTTKSPKES